jgi:hypothetical protein
VPVALTTTLVVVAQRQAWHHVTLGATSVMYGRALGATTSVRPSGGRPFTGRVYTGQARSWRPFTARPFTGWPFTARPYTGGAFTGQARSRRPATDGRPATSEREHRTPPAQPERGVGPKGVGLTYPLCAEDFSFSQPGCRRAR